MRRSILLLLLSIFVLIGCAHRTPFKDEYLFQAMGRDSEIVATADVKRLEDLELFELPERGTAAELIDRSDRLSIGFIPNTLSEYPLSLEDYSLYGASEGNFSKLLINSALAFNRSFTKVNEDKLRYYSNGNINVAVPVNGVLLFSTDSYSDAYSTLIKNREKRIDDESARAMANAGAALFINRPETLIDLGFDLPLATIKQIDSSYLLFDRVDGDLVLSGRLVMKSESAARTMNTILRNQLIQSIKRSGGTVELKAIAPLFTYSGNTVSIKDFSMRGEFEAKAREIVSAALSAEI